MSFKIEQLVLTLTGHPEWIPLKNRSTGLSYEFETFDQARRTAGLLFPHEFIEQRLGRAPRIRIDPPAHDPKEHTSLARIYYDYISC